MSLHQVHHEESLSLLWNILRAHYFAWRDAAVALCPDVDRHDLVQVMWSRAGCETADAIVEALDRSRPLTNQVAAALALTSRALGEAAITSDTQGREQAWIASRSCPWLAWHERRGLEDEDRLGCDAWFASTVARLNELLGTRLEVETEACRPDGDAECRRRIFVETAPSFFDL